MAREIEIEVTKDQLVQLGKAFTPFKKDEIRISFAHSNIVFETSDLAHTGRITFGSESVKDEYIGTEFFVSKGVLAKIESVMQETAKLVFIADDSDTWTAMHVTIKGDKIDIGLPIFEEIIDNAYTPVETESINAEKLATALKSAECAVISQGETLAHLSIEKELTFGSNKAITIVHNMLENISVKVSEDFRKHLLNLTKLGESIEFIKAKDSRDADVIVAKTENIEYKTPLSTHRLPDLSKLATRTNAVFKVDIPTLQESLARISIPLMDSDATLTLKISKEQLELSVFDLQGRYSGSKIPISSDTEDARVGVMIKTLMSVLPSLDATTSITLGANDNGNTTALVFEDSKQKTYMAVSVE